MRCSGGYGGEDPAGVDHRAHVAVEQRQQQAADVRAVHVGVSHQDDLAVPRGDEVEAAPGPRADDLEDGSALRVAKHVGVGRLLDVEDLPADREQRLELRAARKLRGAERRVALDDEQLAAVDVLAAAVGELGRQRRRLQGVLAALGLAMLTCGDPRPRRGRRPSRAPAGPALEPPASRRSAPSSARAEPRAARCRWPRRCRAPPWSGPRTAAPPAGRSRPP